MSTVRMLCLSERTYRPTRRKSALKILIPIPFLLFLTSCLSTRSPFDPTILHDRLIHLILLHQLHFDPDPPELNDELSGLILWIRQTLEAYPKTYFRFDSSDSSGDQISTSDHSLSFQISKPLMARLNNLQEFFIQNRAVDRKQLGIENVTQAAHHPQSINRVKEIIALDHAATISETGGIVAIDIETQSLSFLVIPSELDSLAFQIQEARNSFPDLRRLLLKSRASIPFLEIRIDRTIDMIDSSMNQETKNAYVSEFLELFNFYTRHTYFIDQSTQYSAIANSGFTGLYLGVFHVHPKNNPPSPEDRMESIFRRNVVIVPTDDGFDLHYLTLDQMDNDKKTVIPIRG